MRDKIAKKKEEQSMAFVVATVDLDSKCEPNYDVLDKVLEEHGLFSAHPKTLDVLPHNTYIGKSPIVDGELNAFAQRVFNAVKAAGLCPTKLLVGQIDKNVAVITDDQLNNKEEL